jgi:C4-dicarboxylate transporter DctM subunit
MAIMIDAAKSTANILLLVAAATLFGWVLTANNVPVIFTEFMSSFIHNKVSFLLCVNILMIILGMLMDSGPIILIVGPLLMPMAMRFGVDPVHLGCIIVFNLAVGQATPPFGCCLFSATSVTGQDIITLSKNSLPFVVILFACVFLTTFIPAIPLGLIWLMN